MKKKDLKWINTASGVESSPSLSFSVFLLNLPYLSLYLLLVPSAHTLLHRGENCQLQDLNHDFYQHVPLFSCNLLCCGDLCLPEKLHTQTASCSLLFQLNSLRRRAITEIRAKLSNYIYIPPACMIQHSAVQCAKLIYMLYCSSISALIQGNGNCVSHYERF